MLAYRHLFNIFLLAIASFLTVAGLTSCGNEQTVTTTELASMQIQPVDATQDNDKRFLIRAVEMKYEQILLAKLAQQRTSSDEIREIAKSLEEANREARSTLASLGYTKSIKVPATPTQNAQAAYDQLNLAAVEDFDMAYIRAAIQSYDDAIRYFELAAQGHLDKDIKAHAAGMIPVMRNEQSKAVTVDATMNAISAVIE